MAKPMNPQGSEAREIAPTSPAVAHFAAAYEAAFDAYNGSVTEDYHTFVGRVALAHIRSLPVEDRMEAMGMWRLRPVEAQLAVELDKPLWTVLDA